VDSLLAVRRMWNSFGVEAAHTGPHGVQQKASDYSCIPLCHAHHRTGNDALDKIGRLAFEQRFGLEIAAIIEILQIQSAPIKVGSGCKILTIEVCNLASCYEKQRRYEEAEPVYITAAEGYQKVLGDGHAHTKIAVAKYEAVRRRKR